MNLEVNNCVCGKLLNEHHRLVAAYGAWCCPERLAESRRMAERFRELRATVSPMVSIKPEHDWFAEPILSRPGLMIVRERFPNGASDEVCAPEAGPTGLGGFLATDLQFARAHVIAASYDMLAVIEEALANSPDEGTPWRKKAMAAVTKARGGKS